LASHLIKREEYLKKLIALRDSRIIKIITGVRRCGKSTLLELYRNYLISVGVSTERIVEVNFEDYDYNELTDPDKLYAWLKKKITGRKMTYVFLDEIQHVKDFQKVVDSLYIKENVDLYVTGSNAYMLSGEIATLLSGRYIEISMLPFSFSEFVRASGNMENLSDRYRDYLQESSFPYTLELKDHPEEINDYLNGIYNTIVLKDVMARNKITDPMMLESVVRFAFDNIGNLLSTKKIADTMTSAGRKIDVKTVEKYLNALTESYILYQAKRYNVRGKQYLKTQDKYYAVDVGLRHMLLGSRSFDAGHILENVIYLELLRRGFKVLIGKVDDLEVDFVAMDRNGQTYYQVSASVRDKDTLKRELEPLRRIPDHYPKYILTLDDDPDADYDGIKRINALQWLMVNAEGRLK